MVIAPMNLNEFLPASTRPMAQGMEREDEELDIAKFSAIKKERKDELDQLDRYHQSKQDEIEGQVREQLDRLFQQFQQGMQGLYASLTQTAHATVETQVKLRMQQEKLREEHAINKRDIERRYHNEASRLFISPSEAKHHSHTMPNVNGNPTRTNSTVPSNNGDHLISPAASSAIMTPPIRQQMVPKPLPTDAIREVIAQETSNREYVAPYPTPLEPAPRQRAVGSSETRPLESRPLEPRPLEPRPIEPRYNEQRPSEPASVGVRPVHPVAMRRIYEDTHAMDTQHLPQPRPVPSHHLQHHGRQDPTATDMAHVRPDAKRKVTEFRGEVNDEAPSRPYAKRPRTQEMSSESVPNSSARPTAKQSPHANQPSQAATERHTDRTVTFQEIFQDGKAQYKHKIFEWKPGSGNWYIVRCDEHQVHFGIKNPIHGAAKHMHSPQHGNLEKRHDLAIEICGHRVLGCNAELAELNNREFERALRDDKYRVFNRNLLTKDGRRRLCGDQSPVLKKESPPAPAPAPAPPKMINEVQLPEEGKFYQGLWAPNKKWYMLIVLPIRPDGSLREVGLREKLQETQLMSNVPKCYRVDRISLLIKGFQPAYEDGGPKVDKREYPVMFFDGHQRHSLGWLPAQRLREVDLDNPPEGVDKRGLIIAREWYSQHMMHRRDWEEFKELGPGEPSSAAWEEAAGQLPSLRSAHTDNQSPIQDRPGHFNFGSASGSDDEDSSMNADTVPTDKLQDPSHTIQSSLESAEQEMRDAGPAEDPNGHEKAASHSVRQEFAMDLDDSNKSKISTRPGSQPRVLSQTAPRETTTADTSRPVTGMNETDNEDRTSREHHSAQKQQHIESEAASVGARAANQQDGPFPALSEQEIVRKTAQAKAAAAVMEAASLSRASSEVPESTSKGTSKGGSRPPRLPNEHEAVASSTHASRPAFSEHQRSKSDEFPRNEAGVLRKPSDLHSILNSELGSLQHQEQKEPERATVDPYKQFEAIKAQMALDSLKNRSASAPAAENHETQQASTVLPSTISTATAAAAAAAAAAQPAAPLDVGAANRSSPTVPYQPWQPPSQSPNAARSHSPVSDTSSEADDELEYPYKTVNTVLYDLSDGPKKPRRSSASRQAFPGVSKSSHDKSLFVPLVVPTTSAGRRPAGTHHAVSAQSPTTAKGPVTPTAELGTPIASELDEFELTHFSDSGRGLRWSRESTRAPLLQLKVDRICGWAETPFGSPLDAMVEPRKVSRIHVDGPTSSEHTDKLVQQVQLTLTDGHKQTLVFETQLKEGDRYADDAAAAAAVSGLQGRQFAAWIKKLNGEAQYRSEVSI
ncbi:hypothetical protein BD289DRAFT_482952 [Coniella lustricola]|uniref:Uncharacterized protein n=1 Tax=Coniella lustricola TaxID=2025994 RepID=A0A2T3A722_9PEZI|nr:hypothetical protein BD289DRAFT_482952 [Coniella lustricola]